MGCKICNHDQLEYIERLLNAGRTVREVSSLFDDFTSRTLYRHLEKCREKKIAIGKRAENDENLPAISMHSSNFLELSSDTNFIQSLVEDVCETLDDIDLDAKELYFKEKKRGNWEGAEAKIQTRMQIQRIKTNIISELNPMKYQPKKANTKNEKPSMKDAETIPAEVEEILNQ